ncbi:MAG: aminoacyl-tRNA hydrolase [Minisyncoccia bacterium]|jgi:PTH1 family peptidyl-tRNA hydrolase
MKTLRRIIVGLGNPGTAFAHTYHNVGQSALRVITDGMEFKKQKGSFAFAATADTVFVLPLTFMNESGAAVREAMKKFGGRATELTVLHDESDLPVGKYKVSAGRNAAGHKGVQSIMDALRTKDFTRIRIGIRPTEGTGRKKASAFVLKNITPKDRKILHAVFAEIANQLLPYGEPGGGDGA